MPDQRITFSIAVSNAEKAANAAEREAREFNPEAAQSWAQVSLAWSALAKIKEGRTDA
jgi:hypothetical protein